MKTQPNPQEKRRPGTPVGQRRTFSAKAGSTTDETSAAGECLYNLKAITYQEYVCHLKPSDASTAGVEATPGVPHRPMLLENTRQSPDKCDLYLI